MRCSCSTVYVCSVGSWQYTLLTHLRSAKSSACFGRLHCFHTDVCTTCFLQHGGRLGICGQQSCHISASHFLLSFMRRLMISSSLHILEFRPITAICSFPITLLGYKLISSLARTTDDGEMEIVAAHLVVDPWPVLVPAL